MDFGKQHRGKSITPRSAVRRKKKGPNGEPIGSIATSQKQVDSIVRQAYQELDIGNMVDIEAATKRYLEDYAQFIYNGKEARVTHLAEEHLKEMAIHAKESTCGTDQWAP